MLPVLSESDLSRSDLTQQVALSYLVADIAAQDADVRRFRSDPDTNLPSELLRWEDVVQWIDRHNRGHVVGAIPALWLSEAPIRDRQQREQLLLASREPDWSVLPDISVSVPASEARFHIAPRDLHFGLPDDREDSEAQHIIITEAGGVLDRLRQLSEMLGEKYAWEPAQASVFVLTGRAPLLAPFLAQAEWHRRAAPALDRVVLVIDPALSPKDVAERYSAQRKQERIGPRFRELTAKHHALALFTAKRPDDEPWRLTMQRWNDLQASEQPDWMYQATNNFTRDCLTARRRLLREQVPQRGRM